MNDVILKELFEHRLEHAKEEGLKEGEKKGEKRGKKVLPSSCLGGDGRVKQANQKKFLDWLVLQCKMARNALSYSPHCAKIKKMKGRERGISLPFWTEY